MNNFIQIKELNKFSIGQFQKKKGYLQMKRKKDEWDILPMNKNQKAKPTSTPNRTSNYPTRDGRRHVWEAYLTLH